MSYSSALDDVHAKDQQHLHQIVAVDAEMPEAERRITMPSYCFGAVVRLI